MKYQLVTGMLLSSFIVGCTNTNTTTKTNDAPQPTTPSIKLVEAGRYHSNVFDESAAEIVTFDKLSKQVFIVNAQSGKIDVLKSLDINAPTLLTSLDVKADIKTHLNAEAGAANSVDVYNGLLAVAIEADVKTDSGWVAFYDAKSLKFISAKQVGSLPDMLTFTPNGKQLLVAIEGEPTAENYQIDPLGEIAILDINWQSGALNTNLSQLTFEAFNKNGARHQELPKDLLLNGHNATVAQDIEPEYIAISKDSSKAYVALQENNGIAIIDINNKKIERIVALGFKDHLIEGNELDGNDKDKKALLKNEAAYGMYQPDSISTVSIAGVDYLLTANEGDDRSDWVSALPQAECEQSGFYYHLEDKACADDIKLKDAFSSDVYAPGTNTATLNLSNFDKGAEFESTSNRLKFSHSLTLKHGDLDNDGKVDRLLTFGGRSFSIWDINNGTMVFDSGSDFERITAEKYGKDFNQSNSKLKAEDRSAKKGPEPEALTTGVINNKTYAFIGLERMGGIMVYDISQPSEPQFIQYLNNRNMQVNPKDNKKNKENGLSTYQIDAGDLGPEGMKFVSAEDSPTHSPILIVGNEVSGTTSFYNIEL